MSFSVSLVSFLGFQAVAQNEGQVKERAPLPPVVPIVPEPIPIPTRLSPVCPEGIFSQKDFEMSVGPEGIEDYKIIKPEEDPRFKELSFSAYLSLLFFDFENSKEESLVISYKDCAFVFWKGNQWKEENRKVLVSLLNFTSSEKRETLTLETLPPLEKEEKAVEKVEAEKKSFWPWILWPTFITGLSGLSTGLLYQQRRDAAEERAGKAQFFQEAKENLDEAGDYDSKSKWGYGLGVPLTLMGAGGLLIYYLTKPSSASQESVKVGVTFDPAQSFGLWARVEF